MAQTTAPPGSPSRRGSTGVLGLVGAGAALAALVATALTLVVGGPVDEGYLLLTLGVESRPGGRAGWFAEAGVGGGARVALGYRQRWQRRP